MDLKMQSNFLENATFCLNAEVDRLNRLSDGVLNVVHVLSNERQFRTVAQKLRKSYEILDDLSDITNEMMYVIDEAEKLYFECEREIENKFR